MCENSILFYEFVPSEIRFVGLCLAILQPGPGLLIPCSEEVHQEAPAQCWTVFFQTRGEMNISCLIKHGFVLSLFWYSNTSQPSQVHTWTLQWQVMGSLMHRAMQSHLALDRLT